MSSTSSWGMRPVALGLSLLAVAGGHSAYEASAKTVAISVDGHQQHLRTHGGTVRDALSAAHLTVGAHDLLAPAKGTKLKDGSAIVLRRGRQLRLTIDGQPRDVWVTATSVNEALEQVGLGTAGALLSADRSRAVPLKGFSLDVRTRKVVQFLDAGKPRRVGTNAVVVSDLVSQLHLTLREQDKLSVPLTAPVRNGLVLAVTRIDGGQKGVDEALPFATQHRPDSSMYKGTSKVIQQGRIGVLHRNYKLTYTNHKLTKRVLTSARRTVLPVPEIILIGTKARPVAHHSVGGADGLNWGALANCESGGNPRSVSSNGQYRGLYQFSLGTWHGVGGSGDPIRPTARSCSTSAAAARRGPSAAATCRCSSPPRTSAGSRPSWTCARPSSSGRTSSSTPTPSGASCARPASGSTTSWWRSAPGSGR
jgi:uncharacterized protein YabE (DUF348 family)